MANFYTDNEDIQFLVSHMDLGRVANIMEEGFRFHKEFDFAPEDAADAVDNYARILNSMGQIAGDDIAPTAEDTDKVGNVLNDDGTVTRPAGIDKSIKLLGQAQVMGFTLPYRFGGLNCPATVYSMTNEMISRADASLMNIYGLQGIAETINAFATEDIKQYYLPRMASGEWTGAMVLTEPDAGSDLQAVKTRCFQGEDGQWYVNGVKRFITNGCGEVLLILARSEADISDGRGLSCIVMERNPKVKVRRLEHKLGINGSPTCEIFFDNAPGQLMGERQRGLITYVMSLMNGARIGIAAQALGIGEAAYRVARDYGHSRKQFDTAIENFPAVRDLLVDMSLDVQAARAITYYASFCVDLEIGALKRLELGDPTTITPEEKKQLRTDSRKYKGYNKLLTPFAKYYSSEMSMRVSNQSMAVLGGSGYMKDYPVERYLRDSRITTIYEGTSQLQVVAAVAGVISGTCKEVVEELIAKPTKLEAWPADIQPMIEQIRQGLTMLDESVAFVKAQNSNMYRDLYARKLVDMGVYMTLAALFCDYGSVNAKKKAVARRWLSDKMPLMAALKAQIFSGDKAAVDDFETLAGPVPVTE